MSPTIEDLSNGKDETLANELEQFFGVLTKLLGELGVGCLLTNALVRDGYDRALGIGEPAMNLPDASKNAGALSEENDPRDSTIFPMGPSEVSPSQRSIALSSLTNLASTLLHNVTRADSGDARFQRVMWTEQLPERSKSAFHEFVVGRGATLLDTLDDRLAAAEAEVGSKDAASNTQAGVGIYYFEGKPSAALPDQ